MAEKRFHHIKGRAALVGVLVLLAGSLVPAYFDTFRELVNFWTEGLNWRFFVPVVFLYMVWERRETILRLSLKPDYLLGGFTVLAACALLVAGQVSSTHAIREISLMMCLFGLSLLLLGRSFTTHFFWPLSYLALMTALIDRLLDKIEYPMRMVSAVVATRVLNLFGYDILRHGTHLRLPDLVLQVADSCSGLNQLISMIALAIPLAHITQKKWSRGAVLIGVGVFIALAVNWVRVILIALWHYDGAKESIHGPGEVYGLPFIFLVGFIVLIALSRMLAGKGMQAGHKHKYVPTGELAERIGTQHKVAAAIAVFLLLGTGAYLVWAKADPVYPHTGLGSFPAAVGVYEGQDIQSLGEPFETGFADAELHRRYTDTAGASVILYIGYFAQQNQEQELVDYRFDWLHQDAEIVSIPVGPGKSVEVRRKELDMGGRQYAAFHWYDINGRRVLDPIRAKITSLADGLVRRRTNGAIFVILVPSGGAQKSEAVAAKFVRAAINFSPRLR